MPVCLRQARFHLIQWTGNLYLLSEEQVIQFGIKRDKDFVRFAENYNSGSEPQWPANYFVKRYNRIRNEKLDISHIPARWRGNFSDSVSLN
jgi:hypothetical protein